MNNKPSRLIFCTACAIAALVIAIASCNKKFDAPPAYIPPNITANTSIAALKAMHVSGQVDSLTTDMVIGGVVIANDSSGNFYKQIVLQDSTGGIAVNIDDYNLYATFPIGRKVYVKLKGLYMSEDAGLIYVGGSPDNGGVVSGIASRLKDQYLVKGETNVPVTPTVVTIADLKNNSPKYMYTLVQFNNFEVKDSDTSKAYTNSTATIKSDANIIVKGCGSSDTMIIRSSGYSNFANVFVPKGNGTLTAVYAYYKSPYNGRITPQVIIRDTSDVQFTGTRCDGTEPPPTSNAPLKTISEVRAMYSGTDVTLGSMKIGGVVISDVANGNVSAGNVILQDGNAGIAVYFGTSASINYKVGDSVVVDISGKSLKMFGGSLEIDAFGNTPPAAVANGKTVTPKEMTLANFSANLSTIEYTLVKIKSATASGGSTYAGNRTLKDATGSTTLFTRNAASFGSAALPAGAKDWVGYGNFFGSTTTVAEFQIRNTDDVTDATGDTTTTPPTDTTTTPPPVTTADLMFSEYVEGSSNNKYIELYNAGTSTITLSDYTVRLYANGTTTPTNSARLDTLPGITFTTLPAGGIIVLKNSAATLALPTGITAYSSSVTNFNGDDALTIEKSGTVIDVFGIVGTDPGTSWTIGSDASGAVDHTVRRLVSVLMGNTNWTASSATEWSVNAKDDVSGLGTR